MNAVVQWGWGVAVRVKDFEHGELKTLVIPKRTGNVIWAHSYYSGMLLLRGKWNNQIGGVIIIKINYFYTIKPFVMCGYPLGLISIHGLCFRHSGDVPKQKI